MKFSVVIPTFNRAKKLNRALESLCKQSYKDFEVIVCDDGSTDNTNEVVKSFAQKLDIKYFFETNWGGPARPRNVGIKKASGEWVCFLDSDDWWFDNKMDKLEQAINKYEADVYFHYFRCGNLVIGQYDVKNISCVYKDLLTNGNRIVNSSLCIRKKMLLTVDGFREDKNMIAIEDYDLLIRLAKIEARFFCINQPLGNYDIGDNNISADFSKQIRKIECMLNLYPVDEKTQKQKSALIAYMKASNMLELRNHRCMFFFRYALNRGSRLIKLKSFVKMAKFKLKF